jgi:HEAT repeat protein
VKLAESAAVFSAYAVWRATGSARAGAVLADALASADETNRTAAGVLLVRASTRSLPLLRQNLKRGVAVALSLRLLGDIGDSEAARDIEPFVGSSDPAVARAAADALKALEANAKSR